MTVQEHPRTNTLRVSGIPKGTTNDQLSECFEEPFKRCFIVKGRNYGYVEFAEEEDAESVLKRGVKIGDVDLRFVYAPSKNSDSNSGGKGPQIDPNLSKAKKSRLIVRNISFKSTEETLKKHFEKAGTVTEVNILKKKDGKMVGCAFVQMAQVPEAVKAIKLLNAKPFLGRPVAVDWAVPKEKYNEGKTEKKPEVIEEVEEEKSDDKEEEEDEESVLEEEESDDDEQDGYETDEEDNSDDEENSEEESGDDKDSSSKKWHNLETGHDVDEGKTVFLRNLSFTTEQDDLRDFMQEQFGRVLFARLVLDKMTEHPRGTAFVKFAELESADKCIAASDGEGVFLDNRQLFVQKAMKKSDADTQQAEKKKKEPKDSRNLYLAREGLVRPGTLAAEGVSKQDMEKRAFVERWKRQMLKNLNMIVSPVRLCVRNLPPSIDDRKLRALFKQHSEPGARIEEAKVMMTKVGPGGKSKEYGFIKFEKHEDALAVLRKMNNNPKIFGKERRPIIEFSLEDRKALNARQKRLEKSREKNPNFTKVENPKGQKGAVVPAHKRKAEKDEIEDKPEFMGSVNNPKQRNLPSHMGAKVRQRDSKISRKDLRKREQERKNPKLKRRREEREEKESEPEVKKPKREKPKKKKKFNKDQKKDFKDEKQFNALVENYKSKLVASDITKKKWFE